jgi:Na+-translocating ferredoxin:NAD+ oxidoreductase RnfE subunit
MNRLLLGACKLLRVTQVCGSRFGMTLALTLPLDKSHCPACITELRGSITELVTMNGPEFKG